MIGAPSALPWRIQVSDPNPSTVPDVDYHAVIDIARGASGAYDRFKQRFARFISNVVDFRFPGLPSDAHAELVVVAMEKVVEAILAGHKSQDPTVQDRIHDSRARRQWFGRIAVNAVLDELRRRTRRHRWEMAAGTEQERIALPPPTPLDSLLDEERRVALHEAVQRLDLDQRRVIELALAGDSDETIAASLCVARGTVKSRKHRAVATLRRELSAHLEIEPSAQQEHPNVVHLHEWRARVRRKTP